MCWESVVDIDDYYSKVKTFICHQQKLSLSLSLDLSLCVKEKILILWTSKLSKEKPSTYVIIQPLGWGLCMAGGGGAHTMHNRIQMIQYH